MQIFRAGLFTASRVRMTELEKVIFSVSNAITTPRGHTLFLSFLGSLVNNLQQD